MYCREKLYVSAHELACVYCSVCTHEQSLAIHNQPKFSVKTVYYHKCYRTDSTIYTAGKNTLCNLNVHAVYMCVCAGWHVLLTCAHNVPCTYTMSTIPYSVCKPQLHGVYQNIT